MTQTHTSTDISAWLIDRILFYGKAATDEVTVDTPFTELGLDSIYALTLCGDIEDFYDLSVEPTILSEYPTIRELADGLTSRLADA